MEKLKMTELIKYKNIVEKTKNYLNENWINGEFRTDEYIDDFNELHEGIYSISVEEELINDNGILEKWEVRITEDSSGFDTYITNIKNLN